MEQKQNILLTTVDGDSFDIPVEGSLGLLALGYKGLMLWREKRRQAALDDTQNLTAE